MKFFSIITGIVLFSVWGCGTPPSSPADKQLTSDTTAADDYATWLRAEESRSIDHGHSHLGEIIDRVDFAIPDTSFEGGIKPWVELSDPTADLAKLADTDTLLIAAPEIFVAIDYPLKKEFLFRLHSNNGFTKKKLVQLISDQYHWIYQAEEKSATIKTIPPDKRIGLANRNVTNGDFGIWGHDLSDLVLSGIRIHRNANNEIILSLELES